MRMMHKVHIHSLPGEGFDAKVGPFALGGELIAANDGLKIVSSLSAENVREGVFYSFECVPVLCFSPLSFSSILAAM